MTIKIIKSPSEGAMQIIRKRIGLQENLPEHPDAVGLVQGNVIDMICAADLAEKAASVHVYDLKGVCPQHMTLLAMIGDTASVTNALCEIENRLKEGNYNDYSKTHR